MEKIIQFVIKNKVLVLVTGMLVMLDRVLQLFTDSCGCFP